MLIGMYVKAKHIAIVYDFVYTIYFVIGLFVM